MIIRDVIRLPAGWWATGMLLVALCGAVASLLAVLDGRRPLLARTEELSYLPNGEYLRSAALGYRQLAADLIWLKAVQQLGVRRQTAEGYRSAYHAVDVLTDIDPKFVFAYQATGTILGVWAELIQESVAILTKGMAQNPEVWELPFFLGYDYYYELHDPATAAKYLRVAAALPGAPAYLPKLAARMTVESGDPNAALEFLQRLYQQLQDDQLREGLMRRMKEVAAERDIRFLEEAVRRYEERYRKLPARLDELVTGGIVATIPEEPLGGAYRLNPSDGSVSSTQLRERLHVHRHYMGSGGKK